MGIRTPVCSPNHARNTLILPRFLCCRQPGAVTTFADPLLLDDLALLRVHELVCGADRTVANLDRDTDFLRALGDAHEV